MVLEKTFESSVDCKEIKPVHPKGNQSWIFIVRTDVEAETPEALYSQHKQDRELTVAQIVNSSFPNSDLNWSSPCLSLDIWNLLGRYIWDLFSRLLSVLRSGRSPGGGHDNPLLYSHLENPRDRGAWWATVNTAAKSQTWLKRLRTQQPWERVEWLRSVSPAQL